MLGMALRPIVNPPHRWNALQHEFLDAPPPAKLEVFEEEAKSVLVENESPDVGFRWSVNPYRGCIHGCAYCYARPSHQYWDFGAGTDFERKIVVKVNAPERLREGFLKRSWAGDSVTFSGNTDCYQPLEAEYRITRRCLEVCHEFRNPVGIITKSALIRRDQDVLAALARDARAAVYFSIPFADAAMTRKLEPWAPAPQARWDAMRALAGAGIPVGVSVSPIIPGLNESQIPEILKRSHDAGARSAFHILLRLPSEVKDIFFERLAAELPHRVNRVRHAVEDVRGGKLNDPRFGMRMRGTGPRWEAIARLFDVWRRKLGMEPSGLVDAATTFRRPSIQGALFPDGK
ncbi:MAG: radical SAM domain-containing [Planctomycetota bacterium]|nr:MAG: radical SAM domain-containing [Planctomycetota bacterium]